MSYSLNRARPSPCGNLPPCGMGDVLTDWACDGSTLAASWRSKLDDTLVAGAVAAAAGAATAGVLGALLKRPVLAAVVGAAAGWAAHAVWTAPLVPVGPRT